MAKQVSACMVMVVVSHIFMNHYILEYITKLQGIKRALRFHSHSHSHSLGEQRRCSGESNWLLQAKPRFRSGLMPLLFLCGDGNLKS